MFDSKYTGFLIVGTMQFGLRLDTDKTFGGTGGENVEPVACSNVSGNRKRQFVHRLE